MEEAKRKLDREVAKLNAFIANLSASRRWLDDREEKIRTLESMLDMSRAGRAADSRYANATNPFESEQAHSGADDSDITTQLRTLEAMLEVRLRFARLRAIHLSCTRQALDGTRSSCHETC